VTGDRQAGDVAPVRDAVPARFVLIGLGLLLFGGDVFWCLLARGSVSEEGYSIGMMLLSALGVISLGAGGGMVMLRVLRSDHEELCRDELRRHAELLAAHERSDLAAETQSQALRAELRDRVEEIVKAIERSGGIGDDGVPVGGPGRRTFDANVVRLPPGPVRDALSRLSHKIHGDTDGDTEDYRSR
jgi:hypothetical protein